MRSSADQPSLHRVKELEGVTLFGNVRRPGGDATAGSTEQGSPSACNAGVKGRTSADVKQK